MITMTIIKTYTDYALAYGKYIDKYMVNRIEEEAQAESEVCYELYQELTRLVGIFSIDGEMSNDIMDMLSETDWNTKKISMAENLKKFFDYIS
jgi:hypothetical protein